MKFEYWARRKNLCFAEAFKLLLQEAEERLPRLGEIPLGRENLPTYLSDFVVNGAEERLRTSDLRFTIPPLCQLSYLGTNKLVSQ